jgi:hypothetical protein
MFDPMKLLGEMMDTQAPPTAAGRLDTALGRGGLSAPGAPWARSSRASAGRARSKHRRREVASATC